MQPLISLLSRQLKYTGGICMQNPHRIDIPAGVTAIIGPNGAGKTLLSRIVEDGWNFMTNEITSPAGRRLRVKRICFNDIHSLTGFKVEYYQQRYESTMNDEVPTVAQLFGDRLATDVWLRISASLGLDATLDKRVNYLSSGELRKLLIANLMFDLPEVLVLDNPYIGLDASSRPVLDTAISAIADQGVSVLMLVSDPGEIPDSAVAAIPVSDMQIGAVAWRGDNDLETFRRSFDRLFQCNINTALLPDTKTLTATIDIPAVVTDDWQQAFVLDNCTVRYGNRTLLENVSWSVGRGECWALTGPNGSGKSTLLSLIYADNPQAYSNTITLFGRRRGSGESIWEIKHRIGFVSAEQHLHFGRGYNTIEEIIGGGLNDTAGTLRRISTEQLEAAYLWMQALGLEHLSGRRFDHLSDGEQRLALIARAMIRRPLLLILDEPMHGLDKARKQAVRRLIDSVVPEWGSTLVFVTHYPAEIPSCVTHTKSLVRS